MELFFTQKIMLVEVIKEWDKHMERVTIEKYTKILRRK